MASIKLTDSPWLIRIFDQVPLSLPAMGLLIALAHFLLDHKRKRNYVGQHFWAPRYFVSTVGRDEDVIREYIRHQEHEDRRIDQLQLM